MEKSRHFVSAAAKKMHINGECHVEVKKQCRKVGKILSLEPQALFFFLKPFSRLVKTFCITPVLAKNRLRDTMTPLPFWLPNSPVRSLCKPMSFNSLPQSLYISSQRTDPPHFPHSQEHMLKGTILNHLGHVQTTEIFHFSSALPLEAYIKGNNPTTASSCYILKENKEMSIHFSQKRRVGTCLQPQGWASDLHEKSCQSTTPAGSGAQP